MEEKPIIKRNEKGHLLPGQALNPTGKNGLRNLPQVIAEVEEKYGASQHPDYPDASMLELAVLQLFDAVREGERWAIQDLLDRMFGKAKLQVDVQSKEVRDIFLTLGGRPVKEVEAETVEKEVEE